MTGYTIRLNSPSAKRRAHFLIEQAPHDAVMNIRAAQRTIPQNSKMWAMLTEISLAKPEGRTHTPEVWKMIFMNALGHEVKFVQGLSGEPFPVGYKSSKLTKDQMSNLIEMIYWYAAQQGIELTEVAA